MTHSIKDIAIEGLFGRYDYMIHLDDPSADVPQVSLVYGDNGTGKTTILELVFHLLSSDPARGHRTFVARTPFRRLGICFSDRSQLVASRAHNDLVGSFELEFIRCDGQVERAMVEADPDTGAVPAKSTSEDLKSVLNCISELSLDVFYLGDSRDLEGDTIARRDTRRRVAPKVIHHPDDADWELLDPRGFDQRESTLIESIHRTEQWLKTEVIRTSSTGETDARQSYSDILSTIALASVPSRSELADQVNELKDRLRELEDDSKALAQFGLGEVIDGDTLSKSLASANPMTLPFVVQVLGSFLDGQRARLNAVRAIYEKIRSFVTITNDYFTDKTVEYNIYDGLSIQLPDDQLNPDLLSSGEKHLLLLFLNVFASSGRSSLFIIDEPELSLNVKWQRTIVGSLLALSENTQCQFLMATHSIELIAKHREHVVRLARNE